MLSFIIFVAVLMDNVTFAQERKYEAIVDAADGESVLSGPGTKYYPTTRLNRGDKVLVRRHDPGGWCMIEPPEGSFSWIMAANVDRDGANRGTIKSNRVVVHTGSALNADDFTTIQSELSKGDAIEILDERTFSFDGEQRVMYKINPVRGEYRWIARRSIVPADAFKSEPFPGNPSPKKRNGPIADNDNDAFAKPVSTGPRTVDEEQLFEKPGNRKPSSDVDPSTSKQRLAAIDRQFRDMVHQDPPTWNLDSLEEQYQQLDDESPGSLTKAIQSRHEAVNRYRKIHRDYVDFFALATETKQRDAQLMAQQFPGTVIGPRTAATTEVPPVPQSGTQPTPSTSEAAPSPSQPKAQFDGAGIVQKMAKTFPGGPQFVLLSPDGKMLSFLQAGQGIDLNRYSGKAMGIIGQRVHRDDWNADMITVRSLQPVQLRSPR